MPGELEDAARIDGANACVEGVRLSGLKG